MKLLKSAKADKHHYQSKARFLEADTALGRPISPVKGRRLTHSMRESASY